LVPAGGAHTVTDFEFTDDQTFVLAGGSGAQRDTDNTTLQLVKGAALIVSLSPLADCLTCGDVEICAIHGFLLTFCF